MKNNKLPISPHLQIYKPQITSVLSITHRITGFCLSLTFPLFLIWLGSIFGGELTYSLLIKVYSSSLAKIFFILIIYGFLYHMLNGIRHIIWDLGYGLSIRFSSISGIMIVVLSLISTIIISFKLLS